MPCAAVGREDAETVPDCRRFTDQIKSWNAGGKMPTCRRTGGSLSMAEILLKRDISLANIPAFPAVVLRVLDIASQDNPDFDLLVREITSDATLSAQVLRLANSPLFGFAAQISTVQRAVVALGTAQVQSLVMSVA